MHRKCYFDATLLAQQSLESSNQAFEKVLYLKVKISHDICEILNVIIVTHPFMMQKMPIMPALFSIL